MARSWQRGGRHRKEHICIKCGYKKDITQMSKGKNRNVCKDCVQQEQEIPVKK